MEIITELFATFGFLGATLIEVLDAYLINWTLTFVPISIGWLILDERTRTYLADWILALLGFRFFTGHIFYIIKAYRVRALLYSSFIAAVPVFNYTFALCMIVYMSIGLLAVISRFLEGRRNFIK